MTLFMDFFMMAATAIGIWTISVWTFYLLVPVYHTVKRKISRFMDNRNRN